MKKSIIIAGTLVCLFALTGCNNGGLDDRFHVKYLAVQSDRDDYWSIIDSKGKFIVTEEYAPGDEVSAIYGDVYWVKNDEGYQLYSVKSPKMPLKDKVYEKVTVFNCGRAAVSAQDEPIEIINEKGKVVCEMPDTTSRVYAFSNDGLAIYQNASGNFGYIDLNGKVRIPAAYKQAFPFNEGLALVWESKPKKRDKNKINIINTSGKVLGKIDGEKYSLIAEVFSEGKLPLYNTKSTKVEYIDSKGEVVLTLGKDESPNDFGEVVQNQPFAYSFQDGYAVFANTDGKFGLVDSKGEQIIRPKYRQLIRIDKDRYSAVVNNGDSHVIDHKDARMLEYDGTVSFVKLGNYYIATPDGDETEIIDSQGKSAFKNNVYENASMYFCDDFAEYINIGGLVEAVAKLYSVDEFDGISEDYTVLGFIRKKGLSTDVDDYDDDGISYNIDLGASGRIDAKAEVTFETPVYYADNFCNGNVSDVALYLEFEDEIPYDVFCDKIVKALKRKGFEDRGTLSNGVKVMASDQGTVVLVKNDYGSIGIDFCYPNTARNVLDLLSDDEGTSQDYIIVEDEGNDSDSVYLYDEEG